METPTASDVPGSFTRLMLDAALLSAFEAPNFDEATAVSIDALDDAASKRGADEATFGWVLATLRSPKKDLRCRYRNGKCDSLRTLKKNGNLHSYCEFHRQRSVANQRVFDRKKRAERERQRCAGCHHNRSGVVKVEAISSETSSAEAPPIKQEPVTIAPQTTHVIPSQSVAS